MQRSVKRSSFFSLIKRCLGRERIEAFRASGLGVEPLEDRNLLAVNIGVSAAGELSLVGDAGNDTVLIERVSPTQYKITGTNTALSVSSSERAGVTLAAGTGVNTNRVNVNLTLADALTALNLKLGGGSDSATLQQSASAGSFVPVSFDVGSSDSSGLVQLDGVNRRAEYRFGTSIQVTGDGTAQLSVTESIVSGGRPVLLQAEKSVTVNTGKGVTTGAANIAVTSPVITLGDGATLNAGTLGDISLQAAEALENAFLSTNAIFQERKSTATITVGRNATITGNNINMTADTDAGAFADFKINTVKLGEKLATLSTLR